MYVFFILKNYVCGWNDIEEVLKDVWIVCFKIIKNGVLKFFFSLLLFVVFLIFLIVDYVCVLIGDFNVIFELE